MCLNSVEWIGKHVIYCMTRVSIQVHQWWIVQLIRRLYYTATNPRPVNFYIFYFCQNKWYGKSNIRINFFTCVFFSHKKREWNWMGRKWNLLLEIYALTRKPPFENPWKWWYFHRAFNAFENWKSAWFESQPMGCGKCLARYNYHHIHP